MHHYIAIHFIPQKWWQPPSKKYGVIELLVSVKQNILLYRFWYKVAAIIFNVRLNEFFRVLERTDFYGVPIEKFIKIQM